MYALEGSVVRSHAVVLQTWDGLHAFLRHVLLREHLCELLGTVVAEVDEDYYVALLDVAVHVGIADGLNELVGSALVVALLHGLYHVGSLLASAVDEQVVCLLDAVPALVAVHGVEAADDAGDVGVVGSALCGDLLDEALAGLRVGVAAVHEAVYEELLRETVLLAYLDEAEEVVE